MAYVINRSDQSVLTVVDDNTINKEHDITLVGRHYIDYGEIQNENFVFLLENFSNSVEPNNPISGQLWYDSLNNKLNVFNGDVFSPISRPVIGPELPKNMSIGELWWDSANEQLYVHNGYGVVLIGPEHDRLSNITFEWTNSKLYVRDGDSTILIGPVIDEVIALSHIL